MDDAALRSRSVRIGTILTRCSAWLLLLTGILAAFAVIPVIDIPHVVENSGPFEQLASWDPALVFPLAVASIAVAVLRLGGVEAAATMMHWMGNHSQEFIVGFIAAGLLLRLRAFTSGRSVWLDEAALLISIRDRPIDRLLTEPLDYGQSAPPGFLLLMRGSFSLFGVSDGTARLVPLIAGAATLIVAAVVAKRLLTHGIARVVFVGLLAGSPVLIYYASEAKQYSSDVLAGLLVLLLWSWKDDPEKRIATAAIGAGIALVSLPGAMLLGVLILAILLDPRSASPTMDPEDARSGRNTFVRSSGERAGTSSEDSVALKERLIARKSWLPVLGLWGVSGTLHLVQQAVSGVDRSQMSAWWESAGAFPPSVAGLDGVLWWPVSVAHLAWLGVGTLGPAVPRHPSGITLVVAVPATLLLLVATVVTCRSRHPVKVLPCLSILVALAVAILRIYPFSSRLLLYLLPAALLLVAIAVDVLLRSDVGAGLPVRVRWFLLLVVVVFVQQWTTALSPVGDPAARRDMRSALIEVASRADADDVLLVEEIGAKRVLAWYLPLFPDLEPQLVQFDWSADGSAGLHRAIAVAHQSSTSRDSRYWIVLGHRLSQGPRILDAASRDLEVVCLTVDRGVMAAMLIELGRGEGQHEPEPRPPCW